MPNRRHNDQVAQKHPKGGAPTPGKRGGLRDDAPIQTAAWPGVPGRTQPRGRDKAGTPKVKTRMRSEGV